MALVKRETSRGFSASETSGMTINNSAVETTLISVPIPAKAMGLTKELNFKVICQLTSGLVNPTLTFRLKLAGNTITVINGLSLIASLTAQPLIIEGSIINQNNAAIQLVTLKVTQGNIAILAGLTGASAAIVDWAVDTTIDQILIITAQFTTALTAGTLTFKHASIDLS